jgi:hypothetical protein
MSSLSRARIVVSGIMFFNPVAGVIYQALHYLLGLRALGHDVYYVEDTNWWSLDPRTGTFSPDPAASIKLVAPMLERHGFGDRWAYRRAHADEEPRSCWGMDEATVQALYRDCDAWLNVTGSQTVWDDVARCRNRILVESDPVSAQIDVANGYRPTIDHLDAHHVHFTFGETMVDGGGPIPLGPYRWQPTRQPVAIELWVPDGGPPADPEHARFTTVTSWHDDNKDRIHDGVTYRWTKDEEFLGVIDLPRRLPGRFELAVTGRVEEDRARLEDAGWRLRDALALSADCDDYRRYIHGSYGEFTVAREQYTEPVTGWFSDRSATYLAAGRPVITQETGFSRVLPTGSGLYPWRTVDDIAAAVDHIDADPTGARRAAREIAREHFAADRVVRSLLERAGVA